MYFQFTDHNKSVTCLCRNRNTKECSLPRIPKPSPIVTDHPKKNFVQENIKTANKRPSTTPSPRRIDSKKGNAFELEESGWVPKYTHKEVCELLYFEFCSAQSYFLPNNC